MALTMAARLKSRVAPAVAGALILAMHAAVAGADTATPTVQAQPTAQPQPVAQPQPAPRAAPPIAAVDPALAPFTWLEGCWKGDVNHREFREFWMPARGNVMIGVGQQSLNGTMQDYEYLRLEAKDGVVFSQFSGDRKVYAFKLASTTTDQKDTVFTFDHTEMTFPAHLIYRKGAEGWLYETVEGPLNGTPTTVVYPFRRVSCETGDVIAK
jgi:hypothetical protein